MFFVFPFPFFYLENYEKQILIIQKELYLFICLF